MRTIKELTGECSKILDALGKLGSLGMTKVEEEAIVRVLLNRLDRIMAEETEMLEKVVDTALKEKLNLIIVNNRAFVATVKASLKGM